MPESSASSLKSVAWFKSSRGQKRHAGVGATLAKLCVGGAFGALLYLSHRPTVAYVVWGIAGGITAIALASPAARAAIDGLLGRFGRLVGNAVGAAILTLVYFLVVTPVRFFRRISGTDALHLRDAGRVTYWLPCDDEQRKAKWAGAMFATEVPTRGGHPFRVLFAAVFGLFAVTEGILRLFGFGHPLLYVADPQVGYYPEPNAHLGRYGGLVATNQFGMRSAEITKEKPAGTFRILMLGDSTLFGGSYIDQAELYSTRISEHLNASGLPGKVEILAMGVNGWGPFHERGYLHKFGNFDADLVMVHLPIDDVVRPLYGLASVPFLPVQKPPTLAWQEVANHLMWRYRANREGRDDAWEAEQAKTGIAEYGNLVDDIKKSGSEAMVFVLPTKKPGYGGPETKEEIMWREGLEATLATRSLKTYFARNYFTGKGDPDAVYHDWVHLNVPGHALYAEYIEARLREDSPRFRAWATPHAASKELP
jgi:hypothetical protein